ncbi:MAG: class I SAM-dependent methyltransferase [Proteobacteria bacterium]|nr:class I SAM-dependent methyltransferase [Burkholderiales bacterium]
MSLADARILWQMLRGEPRTGSHAERLAGFYAPQAEHYDRFRERMLHGRRELIEALATAPGETLVELGAGTGRNLEFLGDRLAHLDQVYLVDLCAPLLARARARFRDNPRVHAVEADATQWRAPAPVDLVLCAYSLTMIPDWFAAIDNAHAMLAPGGRIGVVDFYVSRAHPAPGRVRHRGVTRAAWPLWFGHDGVHPSADHLPYLERRFEPVHVSEHSGSLAWLPGVRVPHYRFIGRKRPG